MLAARRLVAYATRRGEEGWSRAVAGTSVTACLHSERARGFVGVFAGGSGEHEV